MHAVAEGSTEGMEQSAFRTLRARCLQLEALDIDEETTFELREVYLALKRLEDGTWGRCQQCGGAVGRDRLRALPETRSCHRCAR